MAAAGSKHVYYYEDVAAVFMDVLIGASVVDCLAESYSIL